MNRLGDGRRSYLQVSSEAFPEGRFKVDDEVSIAVPEHVVLAGSFMVYIVPLICTMLVAAVCGALIPAASDLDTALGALAGFALGVGLVKLHARSRRNDERLRPRLLGPALSRMS
jgi:sigma-E factor negative regulatory protein RseC